MAGVTPGRGGEKTEQGVPVLNTVRDAVKETGAECALISCRRPSRPTPSSRQSTPLVPLAVCITEGIPTLDMVKVKRALGGSSTRLDRPQLPRRHHRGPVPRRHHARPRLLDGQRRRRFPYPAPSSTRPSISSPAAASGSRRASASAATPSSAPPSARPSKLFDDDPDTAAIVLIGEIGGNAEQEAAEYIKKNVKKPVISFIAGSTAPTGRRMGHAGAIISGNSGTAPAKKQALADAGATVVDDPADIGATTERVLKDRGLCKPAAC